MHLSCVNFSNHSSCVNFGIANILQISLFNQNKISDMSFFPLGNYTIKESISAVKFKSLVC